MRSAPRLVWSFSGPVVKCYAEPINGQVLCTPRYSKQSVMSRTAGHPDIGQKKNHESN